MVKKGKVKRGWIFWTPRILSILFVLFLVLFSLDIFDICNGFWSCALGLLMHNLPAIILGILVWLSWKREIIGGIAFFLFGLIYIVFVIASMFSSGFEWYYFAWIVQFSGVSFFVAILYLIGWRRRK